MAEKGNKKSKKLLRGQKLPEHLPEGFVLYDTFKQPWTLGKNIGQGGFGTIYLAADDIVSLVPKDAVYVVKVEYANGPLFAERHCYSHIGGQKEIDQWSRTKKLDYLGIVPIHRLGSFENNELKYRFIVMERLGTDLQTILNSNGNTLPRKTVFTIGIRVLDALEYIHSKGYLHGDIKAGNLLLGYAKGKENQIYLIDMGLASKYIINGIHKKNVPDPRKAHNGTAEFISRDGHSGVFCRRSDLEILGYNLVYWLSGRLPWINKLKDLENVKAEKNKYLSDIPHFMNVCFPSKLYPEGISEYFCYLNELDFEEDPNYDLCRNLLKTGLKRMGEKYDGTLIFSEKETSKKLSVKTNNLHLNSADECAPNRTTKTYSLPPGEIPTEAMLSVMMKKQQKENEKTRHRNNKTSK